MPLHITHSGVYVIVTHTVCILLFAIVPEHTHIPWRCAVCLLNVDTNQRPILFIFYHSSVLIPTCVFPSLRHVMPGGCGLWGAVGVGQPCGEDQPGDRGQRGAVDGAARNRRGGRGLNFQTFGRSKGLRGGRGERFEKAG